jgi:formiminoglutamate deiminase
VIAGHFGAGSGTEAMMSKLFFDSALLPDGWAANVAIQVGEAGVIREVRAGAERVPDAVREAIAVPGVANLHSHAFQRGMAGLAERAGSGPDSFWTWREVMYRFLDRLSPEDVEAIACQLYVEMLEAGFTCVGEFHYLHHDTDGSPYGDPAEMAERIVAAAAGTGIGLTLLPVLYHQGGFGAQPLTAGQQRFAMRPAQLLDLVAGLRARHPGIVVGAAPHSLRAVTPESLAAVAAALPDGPLHIHAAEQTKEVEDCVAWSGRRPVRWLLDHAGIDGRWCLIHATHLDDTEVTDLAASGAVAGLCPVTEANLGDGIFRGVDYRAAAGAFGVGSDSHIRVDLADELRTLEYGQRLRDRRRNLLAPAGRSVGRTLLAAAAKGGAQALRQPMGAIVSGNRADIVTLDAEHPALVGKRGDDLVDGWLFAAGRSPVASVYAAGKRVVENGRHVSAEGIARRFAPVMQRLLGEA